jgi:hypothetical protein
MKLFLLLSLCALLLVSATQKPRTVYSVASFPFQDTLLPGIDNEIVILRNGVRDSIATASITGASMQPDGKGKYIAKSPKNSSGNAVLLVMRNYQQVLRKTFVVPALTPELKSRADAAIDKRAAENKIKE